MRRQRGLPSENWNRNAPPTRVQYSTRLDKIVYGPATAEMESHDWVELAMAALDQAGLTVTQQAAIRMRIEEILP